jgi:hypothetical protein
MIKLMLQKGRISRHVDVKAAFLNWEADREIHVSHPRNLQSSMKQNTVYVLRKALYGLQQASIAWYTKPSETLIKKLRYKQISSDGSVFIKESIGMSAKAIINLHVYVDDLFFVGGDCKAVD